MELAFVSVRSLEVEVSVWASVSHVGGSSAQCPQAEVSSVWAAGRVAVVPFVLYELGR